MANKKKELDYKLNKDYLNNCVVFGKARMNVNDIKTFSMAIPSNKDNNYYDDFFMGM